MKHLAKFTAPTLGQLLLAIAQAKDVQVPHPNLIEDWLDLYLDELDAWRKKHPGIAPAIRLKTFEGLRIELTAGLENNWRALES